MPAPAGRKERVAYLLANIALVLISLFLVALIVGTYYYWIQGTGSYRADMAGKIVEKRTTFNESSFGSSMNRILIIEESDGKRTQLLVNERVFDQARIGARLERTHGVDKVIP